MNKLKSFFTNPTLLKKIGIVLLALIIFRILATIPAPGLDGGAITQLLAHSQLLGAFNIFSGGGLANLSIVMLGVFPYITISIIMQLLTVVIPAVHSMYHEEGEIGRNKFNQISRMASIPVAAINASGLLLLFSSQGLVSFVSWWDFGLNILVITAGAALMMWIGELVTEFGIGNGISIIVFAGIVISFPAIISQVYTTFDTSQIPFYIFIAFGVLLFTYLSVLFNEADRPIPITHARHSIGQTNIASRAQNYLPFKVNPVGVLPLIFAFVVVTFLQILVGLTSSFSSDIFVSIHEVLSIGLANKYIYASIVFALGFAFTFFHVSIILNTKKISNNLKKQGAFITGVRPGSDTEEYFNIIRSRLSFYAATFLGSVAAIPFIVFGVQSSVTYAVGGTGIMIIVSVIIDMYKKIQAHLINTTEYNAK